MTRRERFAAWALRQLHARFPYEKIDGGGRVRDYMDRWVLLRRPHASYYLHRFTNSDWSYDLHDHPKPFLSIGLVGRYYEHTTHPNGARTRIEWRAPWVRRFPAIHRHWIELPDRSKPCWTLVRVGASEREWGWWTRKGFIPWQTYVDTSLPERLGQVRGKARPLRSGPIKLPSMGYLFACTECSAEETFSRIPVSRRQRCNVCRKGWLVPMCARHMRLWAVKREATCEGGLCDEA